jgi:hypothetical protein
MQLRTGSHSITTHTREACMTHTTPCCNWCILISEPSLNKSIVRIQSYSKVPSPRLLGSGIRKILTLPHRLEDHVLYFFTLSSHSTQPGVGSFKQGRAVCFSNNSPCLRRPWMSQVPSAIGAFLGAVATDMSISLTIEALHLCHVSFLDFLLSLEVSLVQWEWRTWWSFHQSYSELLLHLGTLSPLFLLVSFVV